MTHTRQRILVVGLAAAAGALDSWSYVGLAQIFIANMTGNTVLLGASLAMGDWRGQRVRPVCSPAMRLASRPVPG